LSEEGLMKGKLVSKKRYLALVATTMLLLVLSCSIGYRPIIYSLEAEPPGWTAPLGSLQMTCNASDPQGGELSYSWSAEGGRIVGAGAVVNWTAPAEVGMYDITVVVANSLNKTATDSIILIASNGPPPVIENLTVTATHKYLKIIPTGYKVAKTYEYNIACNASDNGTLSYNWTCTGGSISGEGFNITWTAPNIVGDVTVTAKVFDGAGNWVKKSIVLEVVPCTPCEFGSN
jgi:hypothetical protein